ncbi:Pentatricopeptide repeat-containing protein At3g47530 [Linum perenne]
MFRAKTSAVEMKSYRNLISLVKSSSQKSHLLQIQAHLIRTSLLQEPKLSLAFLSRVTLSPSQDIDYAHRVFSQIPYPSPFVCNTMIRAYALSNSPTEGLCVFQQMVRRGLRADPITLTFVIKCFLKISCARGGEQAHARILKDGHQSDGQLLTNLMDLYSICRRDEDAYKVFDDMPQRDTVAWNVLISCFLRNKKTRDVFGLFDGLVRGESGCKPDDVTCLLLLQACAELGALEFGEKVRTYIDENGYGDTLKLCNSLIAMYSSIRNKNVVTWSAMISGLAMNGHGREAIDAFGEMKKAGIQPDDQTFTGLLSACSHCGLLNEGMTFFDRMSKEFGMQPNIHHYGCMVDLMGRVGKLDQAYELIMSMKEVKPDPAIWRTLLAACRIHRHVMLGERVVEHLVELKAQEAGDYVLLLNMYSSVGDWDKVSQTRKFMQERGIQTSPGCSSIILKGELHEFVADDVSHPRKKGIYETLDEINEQLKIAGYVTEITSELHSTGEEEKGYVLSYHSEKLAMAFGILATPPGTTIRIAKNLRTCVDCHNFAKAVSWVYNREVVIRDRNRFHHFREGRCSCNDFW